MIEFCDRVTHLMDERQLASIKHPNNTLRFIAIPIFPSVLYLFLRTVPFTAPFLQFPDSTGFRVKL